MAMTVSGPAAAGALADKHNDDGTLVLGGDGRGVSQRRSAVDPLASVPPRGLVERVARPFVLVALVALLAVPALLSHRASQLQDELKAVIDPVRLVLEDLPLLWREQSSAVRGGLLAPEQHAAYQEMYMAARAQERQLLERLRALGAASPPELAASLRELDESTSRWHERQDLYYAGQVTAAAYEAALAEQDGLRQRNDDAWERALDEAILASDVREAAMQRLSLTQIVAMLFLVLATLFAAALVVWLDARSRELPLARHEQLLAERAARTRTEVLAQVSHDLKTPLSAVLMTCAALRRRKVGHDDDLSAGLDRIERSANSMGGMVADLLDAARREAGLSLVFEVEPTSLRPLLEHAVDALESARGGVARVGVELPAELPPVLVNAAKVERVLQNIIGNAIKFSPPDALVRVRATSGANDVELRISDDGSGIAPEVQERLFDAFWQAEDTAAQGTGLGLAIARDIVEAHGGRIWVESAPGAGSTFAFTLPRA